MSAKVFRSTLNVLVLFPFCKCMIVRCSFAFSSSSSALSASSPSHSFDSFFHIFLLSAFVVQRLRFVAISMLMVFLSKNNNFITTGTVAAAHPQHSMIYKDSLRNFFLILSSADSFFFCSCLFSPSG